MSFTPMADVPNPLFDANGDPYSGAVLKAYLPGTTTAISIYTDAAGSSAQATLTANAQGVWEVTGSEVVPYIDRKHKWGIFANATDATANTPFYMGPFDNVPVVSGAGSIKNIATLALLISDTSIVEGDLFRVLERTTGNGGGAFWDIVLSSTVTENTYNIVQCTGVGSLSAVLQMENNIIDIRQYYTAIGTDFAPGIKAAAENYTKATLICNDLTCETAITITSAKDITLDGRNTVLFDNGIEDDDSDSIGVLRRFLGITFESCENIVVKNFVLQSNTSIVGGNGVILNSVDYSNHLRFHLCTNVTTENLTLDYQNNKPDSAYISEASFVNDILRSFPIYYDTSNGVKSIGCGVSRTNDTGEIIGYKNCSDVTIHRFFTLSGVANPSTHSALFKVMICENVDIGYLNVQTSYNGTMMDVSGNNIRIHDFAIENEQGGVVDITREFGPSGGSVNNVTIENVSTSGKNLISTAPASGVLEANTGQTYDSTDNPISNVRVINCETGDDTHPFSDNESGVNHAIDSTDILDGMYFEGRQKRIKNPESLVFRMTSADTSLDYQFNVVGYTYYQDEIAQDWAAECTVGGVGRFTDCNFLFSDTVAEPNKSLLTLNDLRLINGDAGITPENTTAKLIFEHCLFENVAITIKCNTEFVDCHFQNCIIIDSGIANIVTFDKDCTANLKDSAASLVGTDSGGFATFIYFETIGDWSWKGTVTGEYVKPSGYGVMGSIASSGQNQNFKGATFNVESRASTGGAANEDYCIFHWDRNNNSTYIESVTNDPSKSLMVIVRANVGGASTSARLDIIGCDTRGKLMRDTGGPFTNSTLMMVSNNCNITDQTGTWTTSVTAPNVTGLT